MHLIKPTGVQPYSDFNINDDDILSLDDYLTQPTPNAIISLETQIELELIAEHLDQISHIFIEIESFTDGRGFSLAHRLRHRFGYEKPIWAKGHLIADQFPLAIRCGFDAIVISHEQLQRQPFEHWSDALGAEPIPYRCSHHSINKSALKKSNLCIDDDTLAHLNETYSKLPTKQLIADIFATKQFGLSALVSSFGTDSAVLLHMVSEANNKAPILFIDSGKLFKETITYQNELSSLLNLKNIKTLTPDEEQLEAEDTFGRLYQSDVNRCCHIRKVEPLTKALRDYDVWVSGRKSFQSESRANLPIFEKSGTQIKINPLIDWSIEQVREYMQKHDLPNHPLQSAGYKSIGCAPCTTAVLDNENARTGRWRGQVKTECGIHFINGNTIRKNTSI